MKLKSLWMRAMSLFIAILLFLPLQAMAQQGQQAGDVAQKKVSKEELAQLVAPIALYPDELVAQILMASTYPLEIVEADRWAQQNKSLKGDALAKALEKQGWDPSVKSLVNFPSVLSAMSQKLDLTSKLGDAFLAQQQDVMAVIQELRRKAYDAGNLKTTKEQKVVVEKETIVIQPSNPDVVYVPSYNPTVVYGAWSYPAYPPYSYYPPPPAYYPAFHFAAGVALGLAWGYAWGNCNWHGGSVNYNVNNNFNRNTNINRNRPSQLPSQGRGQGAWQHNPSHRKGVAYKDGATAKRFGQSPERSMAGRRDARGYGGGAGARPTAGTMDRGAASRPSAGTTGRGRDSAFSGGAGSGRQERQASDRGNASRQSSGLSSRGGGGFSGGGSRGGGGFRGGGGRGGGRR